MTRTMFVLWLLVGVALGALFMAVFLVHPAFAAEPTSGICYTEAQLETDAKAKGRKIVGGASYDGAETDSSVVVQTSTDILIYGFLDGCYVGFTQLEAVAHPKKGTGA